MGVETAFLLGVLVGQWIMFWAMWRRVSVLSQSIASLAEKFKNESMPGESLIDSPHEGFRAEELL